MINILVLVLTIFSGTIVNGLKRIEKFGFQTYTEGKQGGKETTTDDVHMTIWWDHEIIQCTVKPIEFSTWYWCYPEHDSLSYCWFDPGTRAGDVNLLLTMEGTNGVWIGATSVVFTDTTLRTANHFCPTPDGGDAITIPGYNDLGADAKCNVWTTFTVYQFFCVSAGSDCNYNEYVMLNMWGNNEARANGDYGHKRSVPVLNVDYECKNACADIDGLYCNGDEYWDPINLECKDGVAVTCPLHSYCDNDAETCLRDCDSFAIDEYLTQCSEEFNDNEIKITDLENNLNSLTLEIDSHDVFETNINDLQVLINNLTERINNNDNDIDNINNVFLEELNNINNTINELKTSILLYDTQLTTIETTIETIQNDIELLDAQIVDFGPYVPHDDQSQPDDQPEQANDISINWLNNNNNNNISFKNYLIIILLIINAFSIMIGYYCCFSYYSLTNNVSKYFGVPQTTTATDTDY